MKNSKLNTNRKHRWRSFLYSVETFQSFPTTDLVIHPAHSCCWACTSSNVTTQWPMVSSLASSLGVGLAFLLVRHCLTLSAPDTGETRNRDKPLDFLLKLVFLAVSQCVIQSLLFEFLAGQPLSLNQVKSPEFLEAAKPGTACGTLGYRSFINYPATLLSFGFLICKMEVINLLYQESMRMK